jgi:hypothetical protein
MTFMWKYIDIPQKEVDAIQQEFKKVIPNNEYFIQDIELKSKDFFGLTIDRALLVQVPPLLNIEDDYNIHSDMRDLKLAINIPLENCKQSITKFWKANKVGTIKTTPNGIIYNHYNSKDCEQISQFYFTRPVIFDSSVLHSTTNLSAKWRRGISLRFTIDPWYLIND